MPKVSDDGSGGESAAAAARRQQAALDKESEAYRQKRERNNLAVKRSREKSRQKTTETSKRVALLRAENDKLEHKVDGLAKELSIMKELLLAHARGNKAKTEEPSSFSSPPLASNPTTTSPATNRAQVASSSAAIKNELVGCAPVLPDHEYFVAPTTTGAAGDCGGLIAVSGDVFTDMFAVSEEVYMEEYVVE